MLDSAFLANKSNRSLGNVESNVLFIGQHAVSALLKEDPPSAKVAKGGGKSSLQLQEGYHESAYAQSKIKPSSNMKLKR